MATAKDIGQTALACVVVFTAAASIGMAIRSCNNEQRTYGQLEFFQNCVIKQKLSPDVCLELSKSVK